jgi:integrase
MPHPALALVPALPAAPGETEIALRLKRHARAARGAVAPETERALRRVSAAWSAWCAARDVPPLPSPPELLAEHVDELAARGRKPAGIAQTVWGVATMHRAAGLEDPSRAEVVKLAMKRMSRALGTRPRQTAPLGETELAAIVATAPKSLAGLRDMALVMVARDLLARRSEAVALEMEDLAFAADGSATALLRRSKTDQQGAGTTLWLSPRTVAQLRRWLAAAGIGEGPVFRSVNKASRLGAPLAAGEVPRVFKRLAARAGLDPSAVSGHSCRVGMAQDLVADGAQLPELMVAGRWRSPTMPARYAERMIAGRGAVARFHQRRGIQR